MPEPASEPAFSYWAFISYSHADQRWATWLHRALEAYRVPAKLVGRQTERGYTVPKRMIPIFRDRDELPGSSDLGQNINEALASSAYLIVISSPRAAVSRWVNEEILTFKAMGRGNHVLTIIVDGEPNATDNPASGLLECFPPGLRFQVGPDRELLPVRSEPIAADARPGGDGKSRSLLKLVAGILGVKFDELVQREAQRARRSLISLFLFMATLLLAAALFVHIDQQKHLAEEQEVLMAREQVRAAQEKAQLEQQKTLQEQAKRQAQAKEFTEKQRQDFGKQTLAKGRDQFVQHNYDQALPYLAAAWQVKPDPAGLRIMLNETIEALKSTVSTAQVFPYGMNGGRMTPDGREVMAWSSADRAVRFFSPLTGAQLRGFDVSSGSAYSVNDVALSQDGKSLLVARGEMSHSNLGVFDAQTGAVLHEFSLAAIPLQVVPLHDGKRAAIALKNGAIVLMDLAAGTIATNLPPLDNKLGDVDRLVLSPDDHFLAVRVAYQPGITVFDLTTGQQAWTAPGATLVQPTFVFSPDSKKVLWTGMKSGADLLDAATGKQLSHIDLGLGALCPMVISANFRPDGAAAIFGSNDGRALLYDIVANTAITLPSQPGSIIQVGFSADGKYAFSAQSGVSLWDATNGKFLNQWPALSAQVSFVTVGTDDSQLIAGSQDGRLRILRADQRQSQVITPSALSPLPFLFPQEEMVHAGTGQVLSLDGNSSFSLHGSDGKVVKLQGAPATEVKQAAFSPQGAALGLAFSDGTFGVWSTADGKRICWSEALGNGSGLGSLALSDSQVGVVYWNGQVAYLDFTKNQPAGSFTDPAFANINIRLDWHGGRWLIFDGTSICKIYADLANPQPVVITSADPVTVARLSPDGTLLAVGTKKGDVNLWDTATGKLVRAMPSHPEGAVAFLTWSPSGKFLLVAENTDELFLFDTATGKSLCDYGKIQSIQSACFAHGDDLIVLSIYAGAVAVADSATGTPVVVWPVARDSLGRVTADADGTSFFVNGMSSVYEWNVAPGVDANALAEALAKIPWKLDGLNLKPK